MVYLALVLALAQWQERTIKVISIADSAACVADFDVEVSGPFPIWEAYFELGVPVSVELTASGCPALSVQWEMFCPSWIQSSRENGVLPTGVSAWVTLRAQWYPNGARFGVGVDDDEIPAVTQTMTGECRFRWRQCSRGDWTRDCFVGAADLVSFVAEYNRANPVTPWMRLLDDCAVMQNDWEDRWIGRSVDPPTIVIPTPP